MNRLFTFIIMVCLCLVGFNHANAQSGVVKGTVTDASNGETLPGVSILVKGTNSGTQTDAKGEFSIKAAGNATLVFNYVGYLSKEVAVNNQTTLNVKLEVSSKELEQVVVVGYGVQKSKDLTSPVVTIKADQITKSPTASPMSAIQGTVAGVQVVNSGAPGAAPTVRIRGVGAFNNYKTDDKSKLATSYGGPLYVVDGMLFDDINFLNNSDIQEMTILKDASASAIYGVRAANGVVLITTKKGLLDRPTTVTYDGYVGMQQATDVLKMANSSQYAQMVSEINNVDPVAGENLQSILQKSIKNYGGDLNSLTPSTNTDWLNQLLRTAVVQSHNVDVSGGTAKAAYSFGLSYLNQDGIMDVDNNYQRFNIRAKTDYQATDFLKLGASIIVSSSDQQIPNNNAMQSAYVNPSIYPMYDNITKSTPVNFASPQTVGLDSYFGNPMGELYYKSNQQEKISRILPSFYADLNLLSRNRLVFKTSYNQDLSFGNLRHYTPKYYIGSGQQTATSTLKKETNDYKNYVWDNTLTFKDNLNKHNYSAMLGMSSRQETWKKMMIEANNVPGDKEEYLYIKNGNGDGRKTDDDGYRYRGLSYFGRVTYDYDGRYLLSATFRADGSSKYQEKWGYFPSVGLGWVLTRENFMQKQHVFDFLKLRASWGKLGNDKIAASDGFASVTGGLSNSGAFGNTTLPGYTGTTYFSYLKWEVVDELDFGLDAKFLDSRLSFEFDYYRRMTNNAVIKNQLPLGRGTILKNNGKVLNSGLEFSAGWSDKFNDNFKYFVNANLSTLKNEVKDIAGEPFIVSDKTHQFSFVGESLEAFYGYKQAGIYQTQEEVNNDPVAKKINTKTPGSIAPGDIKYVDQNGDGNIDAADRVILGSYLPKLTYGFNIGISYKAFDFSAGFFGQAGAKVANFKREVKNWQSSANWDGAQVTERWTGPGSSNLYPSAIGSIKPWNVSGDNFSSYRIEDASFFRIQNIQAGYTIDGRLVKALKRGSARIYLTAERPFTFFNTNGFTPEITDGRDINVYPVSALYTFGIKLTY